MKILRNFKNKKTGFTFIELIITISILLILWLIWVLSYSENLENSRDSKRESDLYSIESALKLIKTKRWLYPLPWDYFDITNAWYTVASQWKFSKKVIISWLDTLPTDPYTSNPYIYSISKEKQEFELWATLENNWENKAFVVWNYKSVSKNILPSLLLAIDSESSIEIADWVWSWTVNRNKFIFNNWKHNLPYTFTNPFLPYSDDTSFDLLLSDSDINYNQIDDYKNCNEIYNAWKNIWTWTYQVNSYWILKDVDCVMKTIPTNCREVKDNNPWATSWIYEILPKSSYKSFSWYCDMSTSWWWWTLVAKDWTTYDYNIWHCNFSNPPTSTTKESSYVYWACDLEQSEILLSTPSWRVTWTYENNNSCSIDVTKTNNNKCLKDTWIYKNFRITWRWWCMANIYPENNWIWWIWADWESSVTKNLSGLTTPLTWTCNDIVDWNKSYCNLFDVYDWSWNWIWQWWGYRWFNCQWGYSNWISWEAHLIFVR